MTRALVLGGGGLTGMAWEAGVLQGLAQAGEDVETWDRIVGTSAGAFIGAHVAAGTLEAFVRAQQADSLDAEVRLLTGRIGSLMLQVGRRRRLDWVPRMWVGSRALRAVASERVGRRRRPPVTTERSWPTAADPERSLSRIGAIARSARTKDETALRAVAASLLEPIVGWPPGLLVTAVDAIDGALVCFDAGSGVPLVDAAAASAALPVLFPPVTIAGRPHIDGGMRSDTNMRLAAGIDELLVLVPIDHGGLAAEIAPLVQAGSRVRLLTPGPAARAVLGRGLDTLDPARRAASTRAGREEGRIAAVRAAEERSSAA